MISEATRLIGATYWAEQTGVRRSPKGKLMTSERPSVTPEHCDVPMTAYPIDFPEDTNPRVKQITRWRCEVCQTQMLLDWVSPAAVALSIDGQQLVPGYGGQYWLTPDDQPHGIYTWEKSNDG